MCDVGICALCQEKKELAKSHVVPKSYFKRLKGKEGKQAVSVLCDGASMPEMTNANPNEYLLCGGCEEFLNENYEKYGTRLLVRHKEIVKFSRSVTLRNFDYERAYLFFLSIIWRASESTLDDYAAVEINDELSSFLKKCIKNRSLELGHGVRMDHFLAISLFKLVDRSGRLKNSSIREMMMGLNYKVPSSDHNIVIYYFVVDGFLIIYEFHGGSSAYTESVRVKDQMKEGSELRVPKVNLFDVKPIADSLEYLVDLHKKTGWMPPGYK